MTTVRTEAPRPPQAAPQPPLIPTQYCDEPNQRFYALALFVVQQSYKTLQFVESYLVETSSRPWLLFKWGIIDAFTIAILLPTLRIPQLQWRKSQLALLILSLWFFNWLLVGGWKASALLTVAGGFVPDSLQDLFRFDVAILEHKIRLGALIDPASHILGSHTIRILPHSTARFLSFDNKLTTPCLSVSDQVQGAQPKSLFNSGLAPQCQSVAIPILFNNSEPKYLQYSIAPLGVTIDVDGNDGRVFFNLTQKDLTLIASGGAKSMFKLGSRSSVLEEVRELGDGFDVDEDSLQVAMREERDFATSSGTLAQRLLGYDGRNDVEAPSASASAGLNQMRDLAHQLRSVRLHSTQSVWAFRVNSPGIVRIERVLDSSNNDVRIPRSQTDDAGLPQNSGTRFIISPCPQASFMHTASETDPESTVIGCQTDLAAPDKQHALTSPNSRNSFSVLVYGYPPLKLSWHKLNSGITRGNARQEFNIDGIVEAGTVLSALAAPLTRKRDQTKLSSSQSQQQPALLPLNKQSLSSVQRPILTTVPVNVSFDVAGHFVYRLDSITDGAGNFFDFAALRKRLNLDETGGAASSHNTRHKQYYPFIDAADRIAKVYPRSRVSFVGCGTGTTLGNSGSGGQPIKLLEGATAKLQLRVSAASDSGNYAIGSPDDGPYEVKLSKDLDGAEGTIEESLKMARRSESLTVSQAGLYSITSFFSSVCGGEVHEPSECAVYTPLNPTAEVTLDPITDACAGEVGLRARFSLSGEPPYKLHYSVHNKAENKPRKYTKTFRLSRDELELRPEQTGHFTYEFISVDDSNYAGIPIGKSVDQVVHPLSDVRFSQSGQSQKVWSCEGDQIKVELQLRGVAPWSVEYKVVGQRQSSTINDIQSSTHSFDVTIPPKIATNGGAFTLSLVRVEDGRGCSQPVAVDDLLIVVHRTKPTAAFATSRKVVVKQGESVSLPLRLTGEGPWKVTYRQPSSKKSRTITVHDGNGHILVDQPGTYELLGVADAHCPGTLTPTATTFQIGHLERPTLSLDTQSGQLQKNGSYIRTPVCEGVDDTAVIHFTGQAPFAASYTFIDTDVDGKEKSSKHNIRSTQPRAEFELATVSPGHKLIEFTSLSDSTYDTASRQGLVAPVGGKAGVLRIEQHVISRPTAAFGPQDDLPIYCVKDSVNTAKTHTPRLQLHGLPPFHIEMEISAEGSHVSQKFKDILVNAHDWSLELPYTFTEPGSYTVFLRSLRDATGCDRRIARGAKGTTAQLRVAEIASIAAVQTQHNHCVGESIDFVLQGASPWNVVYDFNGKKQTVSSKESAFSRVAEAPGNFSIRSVAHHQDSCKSIITDITKAIHPLPTAKVRSGITYFESLHEGDQAEIIFEFTGTPPYTFTYQKTAPHDGRSRKPAKVLETHTVTDVWTNRYSLYTQSEGTWSVTSVQDRYCSYPPLDKSDRKLLKAI